LDDEYVSLFMRGYITDGWALLMDSIEITVSQDQYVLQPEDMKELEGMLEVVRKAVYRT